MASDTRTNTGNRLGAEWKDDEVVLRFPSLNRLMRAFLPEEAVKHIQAAQREQLLAVRAVLDAVIARIDPDEQGPMRTEIEIE
jgi:hypothetical protein